MTRTSREVKRAFVLVAALASVAAGGGCGGNTTGSGGGNAPPFPQAHPPQQQEPANVVGGFAIDLGDSGLQPVVMKPGDELFPCIVFPLSITGGSHLVGGGMLTASPGMHHGNITTRPTDGMSGPHPCPGVDWTQGTIGEEALDIAAGGAVLFGSTTQIKTNEWQSFPDGMGYRIKDGFQIVAHMHYLNATGSTLTVAPKYQWYTIDESKLTQELFPFIWELTNFSIPPHSNQSFVGACDLPPGMKIVNVLPHMHQLGTGLDAAFLGGKFDGQQWLTSPGYSTDKTLQEQYTPALDLSAGSGMTMTCTWNNTTDETIIEGTGINEMCMVFGYGWPAASAYTVKVSPGDDTKACAYIVAP
jgi:hypothetical protein